MASDDEREALAKLLYEEQWGGPFCTADGDILEWADIREGEWAAHFYAEADAVQALHRQGQITEAMVEVAGAVLYESWESFDFEDEADDWARGIYRLVRAALEAAEGVRRG